MGLLFFFECGLFGVSYEACPVFLVSYEAYVLCSFLRGLDFSTLTPFFRFYLRAGAFVRKRCLALFLEWFLDLLVGKHTALFFVSSFILSGCKDGLQGFGVLGFRVFLFEG